jgi:hypothetical protein
MILFNQSKYQDADSILELTQELEVRISKGETPKLLLSQDKNRGGFGAIHVVLAREIRYEPNGVTKICIEDPNIYFDREHSCQAAIEIYNAKLFYRPWTIGDGLFPPTDGVLSNMAIVPEEDLEEALLAEEVEIGCRKYSGCEN